MVAVATAWQFLAFIAVLAAVLTGLTLLARWVRRRGYGGQLMGPAEEIFRPSARRFREEIQVQAERMMPNPSADDQDGRSPRRS